MKTAILASLLLLTGCASDMPRLVGSLDTAECAAWEIRQGEAHTVVTCRGAEDAATYRPAGSFWTTGQ